MFRIWPDDPKYVTEFLIVYRLKPNDIYIYMSYHSANLQKLHFKYLLKKYTY